MHRTRNLLIDIAVVVILVSHAVAFVVIRQHRTRYDGEARAIASWMHDQGEDRVAWPAELRGSVPALLSANVTPVLVDDARVAPQQLAVNDTGVVVTRDGDRLGDVTGESFDAGDLTAHVVKLDAAAATPLASGDIVGQNIARPYRFAPIRNSLRLTEDEPFRMELTLDPGRYQLAVEAFAPQRQRDLVTTIATKPVQRTTTRLRQVVQAPIVVPFTVGPDDAQPVKVRLAVAGDGKPQAFVHQWTVRRTDGA
ncbi:MAG TPA: hypothetical protein VFX21_12450 [Acidimicrobiia bacterium]|nr:hypothetical protein [Acidimicrobiia bacterium]